MEKARFNQIRELLPVGQSGDLEQTVSSRKLHAFLGVRDGHAHWAFDQVNRAQLIEGKDFLVLGEKPQNPKGGRPSKHYHFTVNAAKHIAMMAGTAKGKEAREYFIACEAELKSLLGAQPQFDPASPSQGHVLAMAHALIRYDVENKALGERIAELEPKAVAHDLYAAAETHALVTEVAKLFSVKVDTLTDKLIQLKWAYRNGPHGQLIARAWAERDGYVVYKRTTRQRHDGTSYQTGAQLFITAKGIGFLADVWGAEKLRQGNFDFSVSKLKRLPGSDGASVH